MGYSELLYTLRESRRGHLREAACCRRRGARTYYIGFSIKRTLSSFRGMQRELVQLVAAAAASAAAAAAVLVCIFPLGFCLFVFLTLKNVFISFQITPRNHHISSRLHSALLLAGGPSLHGSARARHRCWKRLIRGDL